MLAREKDVKNVAAFIARDALDCGSKQSAAGGDSVSSAMPPHRPMHTGHTPTPLAPLLYIYHRLVCVPRHSLADNLHGTIYMGKLIPHADWSDSPTCKPT